MGQVFFTPHARRRMLERAIAVADIELLLDWGEVLEDYPDDFPYPSYLLHAIAGGRAIHAVVAADGVGNQIVITVYEPTADKWKAPGFRERTKP